MLTLAVAVAAGVGSLLRYVIDQLVQHRTRGVFPLGTFVVNVTGSLVLGLTTGFAVHHGLDSDVAVVLGAGLAGGYTTLSTWAWETLALAEDRESLAAVVNLAGSVAAGLAAGALGLGIALL